MYDFTATSPVIAIPVGYTPYIKESKPQPTLGVPGDTSYKEPASDSGTCTDCAQNKQGQQQTAPKFLSGISQRDKTILGVLFVAAIVITYLIARKR